MDAEGRGRPVLVVHVEGEGPHGLVVGGAVGFVVFPHLEDGGMDEGLRGVLFQHGEENGQGHQIGEGGGPCLSHPQGQPGRQEGLPVVLSGLPGIREAVGQAADHVVLPEKLKQPVGHGRLLHGRPGAVTARASVQGDDGVVIDEADHVPVELLELMDGVFGKGPLGGQSANGGDADGILRLHGPGDGLAGQILQVGRRLGGQQVLQLRGQRQVPAAHGLDPAGDPELQRVHHQGDDGKVLLPGRISLPEHDDMPVDLLVLDHLREELGGVGAGAGAGEKGPVEGLLAGEKLIQGAEDPLLVHGFVPADLVPFRVPDGSRGIHGHHMEVFVHKQHRVAQQIPGDGHHLVHILVADRLVQQFVGLGHTGR